MTDVTIIIATYNRPAFLEVMVQSVLVSAARVREKVRIVVVDDGSVTDTAKDICNILGVDYIRHPENRGLAETLYTGFQAVDSPYYALWGDDDAFLPNWFELHLAKIAEGWDVVAGSYRMADAQLRPGRKVILPPATFAALKRGTVTCNDGSLVRRDSIGDISFRPDRERAMMMTFWLAMSAAGRTFSVVREPTWLYRRHATNMSNQRSAHDNDLRRQALAAYA